MRGRMARHMLNGPVNPDHVTAVRIDWFVSFWETTGSSFLASDPSRFIPLGQIYISKPEEAAKSKGGTV
jgi:hypothetical protein